MKIVFVRMKLILAMGSTINIGDNVCYSMHLHNGSGELRKYIMYTGKTVCVGFSIYETRIFVHFG